MMNHLSSTPALIVAALVIAASGAALALTGPQYGTLLINTHKLGMAVLILAVVLRARAAHQDGGLPSQTWTMLAVAGAVALLTVVTGGLVSGLNDPPGAILWAHRLLPVAVLGTTVGTLALVPTAVR
ncbi:hypothetical protein [Demequina sp. NBRC 110054]|uniref:hypothetical protein n=1 Tax=Demequina sp. NBRC 110054 TaxID=1570343 RepID=UPI000A00965E|nr:hypothetical protein [Demequina sp. NBRC 110054]